MYIIFKKEYNTLKILILNKFNINLYTVKDKHIRIIFYNPNKFNINDLDKTFGKRFAQQLGNFYICASDNFTKNNSDGRTAIIARTNEPLLCKNGSKLDIYIEIYAQMCKYFDITSKVNLNKIMKIFKPIQKVVKDFDDKLIIETNYIYY